MLALRTVTYCTENEETPTHDFTRCMMHMRFAPDDWWSDGYAAAGTLAVSSMPRAFMTARVVFRVGLPFSLKER